jgi:hypothetical protein
LDRAGTMEMNMAVARAVKYPWIGRAVLKGISSGSSLEKSCQIVPPNAQTTQKAQSAKSQNQ